MANILKWLLSFVSKMPEGSFSLEAWKTCPTARRVSVTENSICKRCYARTGFYIFKNVYSVQRKRLAFILKSIRKDGGKDFVAAMTDLIRGMAHFRIHDSGDFFSLAYIDCWIKICKSLPETKFWAPTREWATEDGAKLNKLKELAKLPNVCVRPSALEFDLAPPKVRGFAAGATSITAHDKANGTRICPTGIKGNPSSCAANGCFSCWDKNSVAVAFVEH